MTTQHNAHIPMTMPAEEALSAWWDDECVAHQAQRIDHLLSITTSDARQSLRCYSLIGAALRQEHLDKRDISTLISSRLAASASDANPLAHDLAATSTNHGVLVFPQSRVRRAMNVWRGAIAASFVAGLVGVGIWMLPQQSSDIAPNGPVVQQAQNSSTTFSHSLAAGASALPVVARVTPSTVLPVWAQTPAQKTPMDPYLMTHFESVSPDLSEVMPSLRMISFQPE
ncbi:MAG: sigma-E factor negative regulatory protein [Halothiobacillus sp.]